MKYPTTHMVVVQDNAKTMKVQLDAQVKAVDQLKGNTRMLENKLSEAKSKKDTLKARAKSASTSKQIKGSTLAALPVPLTEWRRK